MSFVLETLRNMLHRHFQDPISTQCWARRCPVLQTLQCRGGMWPPPLSGEHDVQDVWCWQVMFIRSHEKSEWSELSVALCRCSWGGPWKTGWGFRCATGTPSVEPVLDRLTQHPHPSVVKQCVEVWQSDEVQALSNDYTVGLSKPTQTLATWREWMHS